MQNGGETPASRPTLEAFRSDVPANRKRSRNRSHFWRRTAHLPFTEPTMSSTWRDPDSLTRHNREAQDTSRMVGGS
jgi:hypothetical protein